MVSKKEIIEKALETGFDDIGFTTADVFHEHREILGSRIDEYRWISKMGLDLVAGTDPGNIMPGARSIIVVLDVYFREAFPSSMEGHFGRCYIDDDRVTKDGLSLRVKAFRSFLKDHGIESKVPFNLPHRAAAARAGVGDFGKNCLLYAGSVARKSSWVIPIAFVTDCAFESDEPTERLGCPEWCRNVCIAACPTRALTGPRILNPMKCISYLSYFCEHITPIELREPMGMYIYGCDRCQNVCPRNASWLSKEKTINPRVAARAEYFALSRLLHMDTPYFQTYIWPHMFYTGPEGIWRWKMNVARAMGNSLDASYVPDLIRVFREYGDARVRGMAAWALGRIGGMKARETLSQFLGESEGTVREEITRALECR